MKQWDMGVPWVMTVVLILVLVQLLSLQYAQSHGPVETSEHSFHKRSSSQVADYDIDLETRSVIGNSSLKDPFDVCWPRGAVLQGEECTSTSLGKLWRCAILALISLAAEACRQSSATLRTGRHFVRCAIVFLLYPPYAAKIAGDCVMNRNPVEHLKLVARRTLILCPSEANLVWKCSDTNTINLFDKGNHLAILQLIKVVTTRVFLQLIRAAYISMKGGPLHRIQLPCWEANLRGAEWIFSHEKRWDVDDACIETLKVALRRVITDFMKLLPTPRLVLSSVKQLASAYGLNINVTRAIAAVSIIILKINPMQQDSFWQLWYYPIITHFRTTARARRIHQPDTPTAVSCEGLRGRPEQVKSTLLNFTHLIIINELHYHNYSLVAQDYILPLK
eukprot:scpid77797/ scgid9138/ 